MVIQKWIETAAKKGITLEPADFVWIDGGPTIDGMDPAEWIDALTMD